MPEPHCTCARLGGCDAIVFVRARVYGSVRLHVMLSYVALSCLSLCRAYAGVLNSCVRRGLWQHGASILADCSGFRVTLDLTAHSEGINACHRAQQWQLAVDMMHAVHQNSLQFDVMLCNTAISICETGRRWRHAVYVFECMEKMSFDVDVVTITSAMSACEHSGRWQIALVFSKRSRRDVWSQMA